MIAHSRASAPYRRHVRGRDVGPFGKEVRTVGQVTFDETRIKTIAPKIDGWVDQLFVNATGQSVSRGPTTAHDLLADARVGAGGAAAREAAPRRRRRRERRTHGSASGPADVGAAPARLLGYSGERDRRDRANGDVTQDAHASRIGRRLRAGEERARGPEDHGRRCALSKLPTSARSGWKARCSSRISPRCAWDRRFTPDFEALPGEQRIGRISYIYPTLNPDTRTVRVRVVLPNARSATQAGDVCDAFGSPGRSARTC